MNEITRIHLARVAYDIEDSAKKDFDTYLKDIKIALNNDETLMEVEQRMSEILLEQTVKPGGVITAKDVKVIREQLGEPREFGDEDADIPETVMPRRLMRDLERKQIAGVAAGVGAYFGIDVVIVRLVFILLALVNGLGLLLYLVLWAIMPPARTLSDRLGLRGQTATLESYKGYDGKVSGTQTPSWLLAVGRWMLGLGAIFIGWLPIVVGTAGTVITFTHQDQINFPGSVFSWAVIIAAWACALAFSVFMTTFGLAVLRWNFARIKWPLIISGILIVLAGSVVASLGPVVAQEFENYGRDRRCTLIQNTDFQQQYCNDLRLEAQSL